MITLFVGISVLSICISILGVSGNLFDNRKKWFGKPKIRGWIFLIVNLFWLIGTIWFGVLTFEEDTKRSFEILNAVTGNEGYCQVFLSSDGVDAFASNFERNALYVSNKTDYHLEHVRVIWLEVKPVYDFYEDWEEIDVGFVKAHSSKRAKDFEILLDPSKVISIQFVIYSEGRETSQHIVKRFINNKWVTAQSFHIIGKGISFEIDKDFPEQDPKLIFSVN